ncbi:hypothetical protein KSP39_PZI005532 [Platanthera zijinensis]|uniref:Uncharacterized protein n=1 Tax=Platanthera zijinensis TaxID=2320716 RepID=A0AAP0GAK4_9ASPA
MQKNSDNGNTRCGRPEAWPILGLCRPVSSSLFLWAFWWSATVLLVNELSSCCSLVDGLTPSCSVHVSRPPASSLAVRSLSRFNAYDRILENSKLSSIFQFNFFSSLIFVLYV